jgi:acyl carrier protein
VLIVSGDADVTFVRPHRLTVDVLPEAAAAAALYNALNSMAKVRLQLMSDNLSPIRQPASAADNAALTRQVATLIVAALNLDVAPGEIDPDQPLYGEGLGLDSIDILEIALVVSKEYGVQLRADSEENVRIFGSLRQLVEYITTHRTK